MLPLASAPYPQVVVIATSADADGRGPSAGFVPGPAAGAPVTVVVSGLEPGREYRTPRVTASTDADGALGVTIDSVTPSDLTVHPTV